MKMKTAALLLALVLVFGVAVGGTLAWLTDKTDDVVNTFTTSDIDITLDETKTNFQMIPGYTIDKDPKVTVKAISEKCWLFVKVAKSANFDNYMEYTITTDDTDANQVWTKLDGVDGVYYIAVDNTDADQEFYVIDNNKVSVKQTVTKQMMETLYVKNNDGTVKLENGKPVINTTALPTLTFTAYASQYNKNNTEHFTAAEAWANVLKE